MLPDIASDLTAERHAEDAAEQRNATWRALSAFATEQHHAIRHALDSSSGLETTGEVLHQQESSTPPPDLQHAFKQSIQSPLQHTTSQLQLDTTLRQAALQEAVKLEAEQIQSRMAILNLDKDVAVNLDLMHGGASRAASLAVTVSLLVAATVLLAQVIKKFQLVSFVSKFMLFIRHTTYSLSVCVVQGYSPYKFSDTTLYKWHTAAAALCLAGLSASLANLLWQVLVVVRQKKSWYSPSQTI